MGSPVAGFNDSMRSPEVSIQWPSKAPGFSSPRPKAFKVFSTALSVCTGISSLLRAPKDTASRPPTTGRRRACRIRRMRCIFPALLPAFLVALFGAWCGTFSGGAELTGSAGGEVALLGFLLWVGADLRDPLRLGSAGRLLPAALWIAAAASCWASPVPRAGWVGLILLPAYLALPGAVERAWRDDERDRRIGLRALAVVAGVVALGSLLAALQAGASRSAMPLGHHNLLAAWLVILLPLALQPAREPGRWRWLGVTAVLACFGAVLACRSLAGSAALLVEAAVLLPWRSRGTAGRRWGLGVIAVLVLAVVAAQGGRLAGLLAGADPSLRARAVYWRAGVDGFLARPLLGWGPGSTAWSLASFLHPVPGVNPPGELVGELHSLPVALSYELGATGLVLALALAALFCRRRIAELQEPEADRPLLRAGLAGLAGAAVAALGSAARLSLEEFALLSGLHPDL